MSDKKTRIHHAIVKAQEAFWAEIAGAFPEAQSGDFPPDAQLDFDAACATAVEDWVDANAYRTTSSCAASRSAERQHAAVRRSGVAMKRFLIERQVTSAEGTQTFWVDAENEEDALARYRAGEGGIYADDCEVQSLGEPSVSGETDVDDFGEFPPA